jgi:Transcription factor WhiB
MTRSRVRPPESRPILRMPPALRSGTCASHPQPHLWSAPATAPAAREAAQHICRSCPALDPCRAWSLSLRTLDDPATILGALTPEQRALVRRARQRALRKIVPARRSAPDASAA